MKSTTSLKVAGSLNALFFLFHVPFYWMLNWEFSLACLSKDNWAIVQCFNIIAISLLFLMSFVSLFQTKELLTTKLGTSFMIFCIWFYSFRIAAEFIFFGIQNAIVSGVIIVMCALPVLFYVLAMYKKE